MKQFLISCILFSCMNACSYGQDRIFSQSLSAGGDPAIRKVNMTLAAIQNLYVDTVNLNKLADDAIIGLLDKLDPHSDYMTADEVKELSEPLQGNFDGIGIQFNIQLTDTLYVIEVIHGGPSEKVGLLPGDKIIYVDDTLIAGVKMKNTEVMGRLKGPKGTVVRVRVLRNGVQGLLNFTIIRDRIPVYSISSAYMVDKKTGYIKIDRFARTTDQEFEEAMRKLRAQGMDNLIIDLQENGGGYLDAAIDLSNEFLKPGSLIVYTEGAHQRRREEKSNNSGSFKNGKLVILVNENTASASEIFSGAIQDWDRGVIVGRRTFGKGLVQAPIPFPDGSMMRLTTARYYTPTGRSIQKPYTKGDQASYAKDLIDRYNRGEMLSADSIHFPDSLKYSTLTKNRIVYGGGGIMPDYFVPFDTTGAVYIAGSTPLYREISNKGILIKYVRTVIEENRKNYLAQYPAFDSFKKNFTVSDNLLNGLLDTYRKEKAEEQKEKASQPAKMQTLPDGQKKRVIEEDEPEDNMPAPQISEEQLKKDLEKSKPLFLEQIKMLIAREVYGENEYYQLLNPMLDTYKKAVEIISNDKSYNLLLTQDRKQKK